VAVITLADLTASEVAAFLSHAEHDRGGTIGTRNCRLAAIRSFFHFVATKYPPSIAQCVEILNIPIKRAPVSEPCYLDPAEVTAILAQPDRSTIEGMRDHALLSFLYNSGARIQEALDLCPEAIRFESPSCVRLTGKGRKERICPLWPETVNVLRADNRAIFKAASKPARQRISSWRSFGRANPPWRARHERRAPLQRPAGVRANAHR
jgi:integrase/recombinase XerC